MNVNLTTLGNGVRVVTHSIPEFETTSVGVWVNAGGRHETDRENGLSHFIEHMAFKGTGSRNAQEIALSIEKVGGDLNAATSKELTAYYARVLGEDVGLAIEILGDIVLDPMLDEIEFERERDVILQEIAASKDSPDDIVYDSVQETAFPDQPIGRTILGEEEIVREFSTKDLKAFMKQHYTAERFVIAAVGRVDHDQFVTECEKIFGALNQGAAHGALPANYAGGKKVLNCAFEQSHMLVAFEGPNYCDQKYYDALVLSGLLGGGMSSRLFQEVRERRGLCYSVYSFATGYSDTGLFGIHAATSADKLDELMGVIRQELDDISGSGLNLAEIDVAKAQLKSGLLMSLENSMARAEHLARQIVAFNKVQETRDLIEKVEGVTLEGVQDLCREILGGNNPSLAIASADADRLNIDQGLHFN